MRCQSKPLDDWLLIAGKVSVPMYGTHRCGVGEAPEKEEKTAQEEAEERDARAKAAFEAAKEELRNR